MKRDLQRVLRALEQQGWTVTLRRGGHYKLTSPVGEPYFAASSPSDWRGHKNMIAHLKRMGAAL